MLFDCVIEVKLLRMLKDLSPIRDIFLFHDVHIMLNLTVIQ